MAVKVQFEIGHTARLRSKKTSEGFTHDWELYVRGVKEADISTYVDKVVFNLHDSFPKPKRVCNKPPYVITESGYAGFLLPIDIYFRNRDEPKRIQFTYDLDLQQTGPPHHRFEVQKFVFDHVSDEFRQKLLKGGGIPVTGAGMVGGSTVSSTNNTPIAAISDEGSGMVSKPKLSSGESIGGSSGKKHKTRIDDSKSNSFANLFGAPIKSGSNKHSPDGKNNSLNAVGGKGAPTTSNTSGSGAGTGGAITPNSGNINSNNSIAKEKSSKDREKTNSSTLASSSNEKSREKSDKKEKHKSSSSPNKESRENKKSSGDSSKHEKREESKSKKDKSRDKERERSREKGSSGGTKRSLSPKSNVREAGAPSPKRPTPPRSSSSASGRVEDIKSAGSSSKIEGKESKSREEKSTSSGKKSKKEKKDKDKDKERDKERRDEHKEKHRSGDGKSRDPKEERHGNIINSSSNTVSTATTPSGNIITNEAKDNKGQQSPANFSIKKTDKDAKEKTEAGKGKNNDKNIDKISTNPTTQVGGTNATTTSADKKLPTSSNNQSEKLEKDKDKEKDKEKRSHKHKKKDKNKDKDKEREKERDKERYKEREKEKEKERDKERSDEKLRSEKHTETNSNGNASSMGAASTAISGSKAASLPVETTAPQNEPLKPEPNSVTSLSNSTSNSTNSNNLNNNANNSAPIAPIKKSQNRDRKNKDKSSKEEKRNSGELGELESRSSSKHGNKSAGTIIPVNINTTVTASNTTGNNSNKTVDASDTGKVPLPEAAALLAATSATNPAAVTSTDIAPVVMHSDSSNSSFPDLTPKPPAPSKVTSLSTKSETTPTEKPDKTTKEHKQRSGERNAKTKDISDKTEKADKKVEKEEKKRRRSSVAASTISANSFLEPPLKQAKKESNKTAREQTKSPALRQSRAASISGPIGINNGNDNGSNSSNATTQNSNSNATDALNSGGAFLPPPNNTTGTSVTSSPSTLAITSNANANLNANGIVSASTTGAAAAASLAPPHPLRPASPAGPVGAMAAEAAGANNGSTPTPALPTEYLSELQELHHKIMTLQDNEELQQVVEMIAATGCYEITAKTFDFDLCKLDRSTVQRLQEFFATSVS